MPTYILLLTLTTEGREAMLEDPESLIRAEAACSTEEIQSLGLYGVLGDYDFVSIVEAPDNEAAARFSLELGVRAGAHITTLPAVPIARFENRRQRQVHGELAGAALDTPHPMRRRPGDGPPPARPMA
ncbi:MAG: GYD domain-containing protein [Chloroflexi bacterium]|nr:GYD domain-containing protein [Chloroflexota bacterium]